MTTTTQLNKLAFAPLELTRGEYRVSLEWIGEGDDGDYDADDPKDAPLLRFEVLKLNPETTEFEYVEDTSYCTQIDARAPIEVWARAAARILDEVSAPGDQSLKHLCGRLSWLATKDFQ